MVLDRPADRKGGPPPMTTGQLGVPAIRLLVRRRRRRR
jgi:hypothetical protein